jgi:hypothetical protein
VELYFIFQVDNEIVALGLPGITLIFMLFGYFFKLHNNRGILKENPSFE